MVQNIPKLDVISVKEKLEKFIKTQVKKSQLEGCVLGLSGGLDSAIVAFLCKEAIGADKTLGLILPYRKIKQNIEDVKDAKQIAKYLKINYMIIDISPMIDIYFKNFQGADRLRRGNKMARERMAILYDISKKYNMLVVGAGNKSERLLGYFTIYGDNACAIAPLGNIYKTQIRKLAEGLRIPEVVINKSPSAGLWEGQTDEQEMGFEYKQVDRLLYFMVDKNYPEEMLLKMKFPKKFINKIKNIMQSTEYKRRFPVMPKIL